MFIHLKYLSKKEQKLYYAEKAETRTIIDECLDRMNLHDLRTVKDSVGELGFDVAPLILKYGTIKKDSNGNK